MRGFYSGTTPYLQAGNVINTTWAEAGMAYLTVNSVYTGVSIIDILDYANANKYKTVKGLSGTYWGASGAWRNSSAVTSVTVFGSNGNFGANSTFSLYGIKS
jgi:hypothetical protein